MFANKRLYKGVKMKNYIKKYISEIDTKINDNHKFSKEEIYDFKLKLNLFQKERIVHLIITLSFALFTFLVLFLTKHSLIMFIPFFIFLILDFFYIYHYFFLENSVQYMYKQYDKMNK